MRRGFASRPRSLAALCLGLALCFFPAGRRAAAGDPMPDLIQAVCLGDGQRVRELLDSGHDPNVRYGRDHWTALHFAVNGGELELVPTLLDAGAELDAADDRGMTPAALAAALKDPGALRLLLERGANPDGAASSLSLAGTSPLYLALLDDGSVRRTGDVVRLLLQFGADPNANDGAGMLDVPPLFFLPHIEPELADLLIVGGTDCAALDSGGFPALSRLCESPGLFLRCLRNVDDPASLVRAEREALANCGCGRPMLERASSPFVIAALLLAREEVGVPDAGGVTALMNAAMRAGTEKMALLLRGGADARAVDERGFTALHYAVAADRLENARLLLDYGADASALDRDGATLLWHVAGEGTVDAARLLLAHGVAPDSLNDVPRLIGSLMHGRAPLENAVRAGRADMVATLLEAGADPGRHDEYGVPPVVAALAANRIDIAALLAAKGARPARTKASHLLALCAGADGEAVDFYFGLRPEIVPEHVDEAFRSVFRTNPDAAAALLKRNANVNARFGLIPGTALHREAGDVRFFSRKRVSLLLEHGADISARDGMGRTPAHLAAAGDNVPALVFLASRGANLSLRDYSGKTPRDLAVASGSPSVLAWFERRR